ncbi:hypothetical protein TNCV_284861 [Trichonephila clavipes]|uniref:Uncharacterized protein n=1 Tax=Trichonephila clavipes TaxID=2585209 RepID=A0A8X6VLJ6_TRICX|nr:hypothetical protein TNCV_284861 [Trichonephila clavipes]
MDGMRQYQLHVRFKEAMNDMLVCQTVYEGLLENMQLCSVNARQVIDNEAQMDLIKNSIICEVPTFEDASCPVIEVSIDEGSIENEVRSNLSRETRFKAKVEVRLKAEVEARLEAAEEAEAVEEGRKMEEEKRMNERIALEVERD